MKVIMPEEMVRIETASMQGEEGGQERYMEQAGLGVARYIKDYLHFHHRQEQVLLLCGKGNNGGDAFTAGRILLESGIEVSALHVAPLHESSPLCQQKAIEFKERGGFLYLFQTHSDPICVPRGVIVDGLFGTGFKGELQGLYLALVKWANKSGIPILAIDIPSGLNGADGTVGSDAIIASETFFLGIPKTGFFVGEGWNRVGKLRKVDFGIPEHFFSTVEPTFTITQPSHLSRHLPALKRTRHKYEAGYVLLVAGSLDMPGAAILAAHAAMRAGAGLVRLVHPQGMQDQLAGLPPEILRFAYDPTQDIDWKALLHRVNSVIIGPGLGRETAHVKRLDMLCFAAKIPILLDADALFFVAQGKLSVPKRSILTPHLGELSRLLGVPSLNAVSLELLEQVKKYARKHSCTLIVKGSPTYIVAGHETIVLSLYGDPGMATAGSGDVLSGILGALLAQGLSPFQAAQVGTFLHGFAGERAARNLTSYSLCARDLIEALPLGFQRLIQEQGRLDRS